jgi:hypothetical protein
VPRERSAREHLAEEAPALAVEALGAQLMRAALDFDRLITRNRSHEETITQMRLHAHEYDPACLEALAAYGPCPEHRKTYQPVKDYLLPLFPFSGAS